LLVCSAACTHMLLRHDNCSYRASHDPTYNGCCDSSTQSGISCARPSYLYLLYAGLTGRSDSSAAPAAAATMGAATRCTLCRHDMALQAPYVDFRAQYPGV